MKKKEVFRDYKFSDAKLVTVCNEKTIFFKRDKTEFEGYGIMGTDINQFENQVELFADTTTDIEFLNDKVEDNAAKTVIAEALRVTIRNVMGRVVLKYPENTARYRKFGAGATAKQTDAELLATARRVVRVGTSMLADLAEQGVTIELLQKVTDVRTQLKTKIDEVDDAVSERDIQQEARVEAGNALYAVLVKYTSTGQSIWATSNVAKYNDYVLYNTPSGGPEDPTPPAA
jgi:hypothetical protein